MMLLKPCLTLAMGAAFAFQFSTAPVNALDKRERNALGALAILGIAAMAHNKNHYHEGYEPADEKATAAFERGYRDGLHNEPYDSRQSSASYGQGYDAGDKERANRLAHKNNASVGGTKVPRSAVNACRDEVATSLGVHHRDVHVIKAGQEGSDNFYFELASGHKHLVRGSNAAGKVFNLRNGRL